MEKKLERNEQGKMIAGVAAGLSDYLDIDVTVVRIIFILLTVCGFSGVLIYIVCWIAIPEKPFLQKFPNFDSETHIYEEKFKSQEPFVTQKKKSDSGRVIVGLALVLVGAYFMLNELNIIPDWFSIFKLWPLILIVLGLIIIFNSGKKKIIAPPAPASSENTATSDSTEPQPNDK